MKWNEIKLVIILFTKCGWTDIAVVNYDSAVNFVCKETDDITPV